MVAGRRVGPDTEQEYATTKREQRRERCVDRGGVFSRGLRRAAPKDSIAATACPPASFARDGGVRCDVGVRDELRRAVIGAAGDVAEARARGRGVGSLRSGGAGRARDLLGDNLDRVGHWNTDLRTTNFPRRRPWWSCRDR